MADGALHERRRERTARRCREPHPGEHGSHCGAVGELEPHAAADADTGRRERDLHGCEQCVDSREHRDVARRGAGRQRCLHGVPRAGNRIDSRVDGPSTRVRRRGADRLGDAAGVVAQQPVDDLDDAAGASVVHFQRVFAGPGEVRRRSRSATGGRRRCIRRSSGRRRRRRTPRSAGAASSRIIRRWAGVRSWNSSTSSTRHARCAARGRSGSRSSTSSAR